MKKYSFLLAAALVIGIQSQAQQTLRFSNYLFNKMILNPAAAGSNDYIEIMGSYRKQWEGFNGSPRTSFLSVDGSAFSRRLGLGLQLVNDKLGALNQTGVIGNVAGRIRVSENGFLSLGVSTGYFRSTIDGNELTYRDQNETVIPTSTRTVDLFDFKAGIYYKDLYNFGGISVFNVLEPKLNYSGKSKSDQAVFGRHYYLFAGRVLKLNQDYAVVPSLLYKLSSERQDQWDFNAKLAYRNVFAAGVSYRNNESIGLLAEYIFQNILRVGYAFDYNTNQLRGYQNGSHEIMLAYRIIRNKEIVENPRYFYNN